MDEEEEVLDLGLLETLGYVGFAEEEAEPDDSSGVLFREPGASPGYDLVTSIGPATADIYDGKGRIVHSWHVAHTDALARAHLLENGDILAVGGSKTDVEDEAPEANEGTRAGSQRYLARIAWDGTEIWRRPMRAHHDVEVTPHGYILVLEEVIRDVGMKRLPHGIVDHALTLLDGDGRTIARRSVYEILKTRPDLYQVHFGRGCPDTRPCDVFHANSIEWLDPEPELESDPLYGPCHVAVSLKHKNLVFITDYLTGELIWKWGPGETILQHEATLTRTGNILLFDNGRKPRRYSRVVEVDPRTSLITWEYKADPPEELYSNARGTVQELENGNVLIAESMEGRAFEVTREGKIVWSFAAPRDEKDRRATIRVERYPAAFVEPLLDGAVAPGERQSSSPWSSSPR